MSNRQEVIPAKDCTVWYPLKDRPLGEDGEYVIWSSFWERRLKDKSITLGNGVIADSIEKQAEAVAKKKSDAEKKAAKKSKPSDTKGGNK